MGTVSKWINIILEIVEAIIGIHILLKLFHANPNVPFVHWMYRLSAPLLRPFNGIFHDMTFQGKICPGSFSDLCSHHIWHHRLPVDPFGWKLQQKNKKTMRKATAPGGNCSCPVFYFLL